MQDTMKRPNLKIIIQENFPNLKKEMPMIYWKSTEFQIDWTRKEIPTITKQSKHRMHKTKNIKSSKGKRSSNR